MRMAWAAGAASAKGAWLATFFTSVGLTKRAFSCLSIESEFAKNTKFYRQLSRGRVEVNRHNSSQFAVYEAM
jgi:hypothetical protein